MDPQPLFEALAPLVAPEVERVFQRRDLCILSTRIAIEVARYFGVDAQPTPVQVILYNAPFAKHVACDFTDVEDPAHPETWGDESWSVGIGCGAPARIGGWDGHLIALAQGCYADFSISQAERIERNIVTGEALVGPWDGRSRAWKAVSETTGTVIEYRRIDDDSWRSAPDWRDTARWRPLVGKLVRAASNRKRREIN